MSSEVKQLENLDSREWAMLSAAVEKFLPVYRADSRSAVNKLTFASRKIGRPRGVPIAPELAHSLFQAALGQRDRERATAPSCN